MQVTSIDKMNIDIRLCDCIARVNSKEHYDEYVNSGFFTLVRKDAEKDTKADVLEMPAKHFGFIGEEAIY